MFTRMIGLDEFVAAQGDEAARQAVHAHNQIVDRRLTEFRGKRIKHVHDGTMAAFMATTDAIRAAGAIRADFAEQSRQAPDRRLTLAIGLNCGEPIAEGNDLFGVSVQLAARVAGTARPGQILVSEAVRERLLAKAPTATFAVCGPFPLKGFSDPIPLYELTGI
jgi:class 3 adenylate cyclase